MGMVYKMNHIILRIMDGMFKFIVDHFEGLSDRILLRTKDLHSKSLSTGPRKKSI